MDLKANLTLSKFLFTGESSHPELQSQVDPSKLPDIYGGTCRCVATCVYSEKGPWSPTENTVNYRDRDGLNKSRDDEELKFNEGH